VAAKKREPQRKPQGKSPIVKDPQFIVRLLAFLALAVGLNLLFRVPNFMARGAWYLIMLTTDASVWLIKGAGIKAMISSNNIILSNQTLVINAECTAIYLMILYASFVLVYPTKWSKKLVGVAAGIPSIFAANVIRLLVTAWIVVSWPQYFQYFHDYTWQVAFIIFIVVLWLVWIERVVGYERKAPLSN
jgi:archaeosortase B (VPXXXP-CTERM-specific)